MTMRIEISIVPFGEEDKKRIIRTIDVHNMRQLEIDPDLGPKCQYEIIDKEKPDLDVPVVEHYRNDGALPLAFEVLGSVDWADFKSETENATVSV